MTKQSEATVRFEKRWKQALEQPELIEAPAVKLDVDLSPVGVLKRRREIDRDALGYGAEAAGDMLKGLRDRWRRSRPLQPAGRRAYSMRIAQIAHL